MTPPIFICNGTVRSGSTWSFNVCRKLAAQLANQRQQPVTSQFLDHHALDANLRGCTAVVGPTVIKTHGAGPLALHWLRQGKLRAVCTYRDPRDCVASDRTFLGWDLNQIIRRVYESFDCLDCYEGISSILFVRYEDMMRDTLGQIRRIADHLGVQTTDAILRRIDGETNVQSSLKVCQTLKHRSADQVIHVAEHRVDPDTHLHDNHIYNSKIGRWRDELPTSVGDELTRLFQPWLLKLGYIQQGAITAAVTASIDTLPRHDNVARQERMDGQRNAANSTPTGHHSWNAPVRHINGIGAA